MKRFLIVAALASAAPWAGAFAQQSNNGCATGAAMAQAATQAAERERQMLEQIAQRGKQLANSSLSCLDKFANLNLSSMVGFAGLDLGSLMNRLISGAANAACRAVDGAVNQATQPFNQSFALPGGMGRVDTRLFGAGTGGGAITVQGQVPGLTGPTTVAQAGALPAQPAAGAEPSVWERTKSYVGNIFK